MPSNKEHDLADELSKLLLDIMMLRKPPHVPDRFASIDSVITLHANLLSLRDFLDAASHGDLSSQVAFKGYIGGTLKTLQANLKHMTWQTKMIASGDLTQRIEFMGEFSQSFNAMVTQLDRTLKELVGKETELSQVNEELLKEINIRKQTEVALRESEAALRLLATTDSLTGLFNRRHFIELAETEISRALRYSQPLAVMMLDIDFFKRVNDTYGHASGDTVLQQVAKITKGMLRVTDIPARYGGEEFLVLLPGTPATGAAAIAERLRRKLEETTIQSEKGPISITVSIGVSDYLGETNSKPNEKILSEFVRRADQALYASKNAGRNRVTVYKAGEVS